VSEYAEKYGIDKNSFLAVTKCENREAIPDKQSNHRYTYAQIAKHPDWGKVGDREKSFGLWQIHLPSHPNITYEQAIDPEWSTDWAARQFKEGRAYWWTCYLTIY